MDRAGHDASVSIILDTICALSRYTLTMDGIVLYVSLWISFAVSTNQHDVYSLKEGRLRNRVILCSLNLSYLRGFTIINLRSLAFESGEKHVGMQYQVPAPYQFINFTHKPVHERSLDL